MLDLDAIADVVAGAVREATGPLLARIDALEQRELVLPEKGDPGVGVVSAEIRHDVLEITLSDGTLIEAGGVTPRHGKDADPEMVKAIVDEMTQQAVSEQLAEAVKAMPAPEPVDPIAPDMEAIGKLIDEGIARVVAQLPKPEKGEPGIGVAGGMIDREGDLVLTLSNGEKRNVGRVVGNDGKSPPPFTLDDFDVEPVNERTIRLGFTKDNEKHTFELAFPVLIGRGIWSDGEDYERGDVVTWGGSAWEAVEPEKGIKPDLSSGGWRILAKRGRDGKAPK